MKFALLVHQSQEYFDRRDDAAAMAAGRAYGEALQAAGVFVGGAGLEFAARSDDCLDPRGETASPRWSVRRDERVSRRLGHH